MGKNEKKTLEIDILAKLVENNITSKLDQIANSINNIENKKITPEVDTSKIKKQSTKTKDIVKDLNKFITKNLGNGFEIPISTKLDEQILKEIRGTISNKITEVKKVLNPKQESYKTILGLTDDKFITDFATKNIKGSASARTNNLLKKQLIAEQDKDFYKTAYTNILTLREGIEEDEKKLRGYTGDLFSKKNIPFNDDEFFSIANVRREYANKINEYNKLNNVLGDKFKLVDKIYSSKAEENQYLQNFDNAYIQRTLLNIKGVQQLLSVMTSVEDVSTSVNSSLRTIKSTLSLVTKGKFDFYSTKISTTDSKSIAANMRDFANLTLEEAKSEFKKQYSEHIKNPDRNKENLSKPAALYGAYLGLGGNPNDLGINIDEIKGYIGEKDIITRYMQKYYENKIEAKRLLKLMTRLKNPNEIDDIIAKEKKKAGRPKKESIERPDSNKQEIESKKKVSETPVIEQKPKEKKPKKEKPVKQAEPKKEEVTQEETPAIQEKPKKQATKKQTKKQAKKEELKAVTDTTPVVQQPVIEEKKEEPKKTTEKKPSKTTKKQTKSKSTSKKSETQIPKEHIKFLKELYKIKQEWDKTEDDYDIDQIESDRIKRRYLEGLKEVNSRGIHTENVMGKYSWLNRLPQLSYDDINNRLNDLNYLDIYDDLVSKISPMFKDNEIPQDILENLKFYSRRVNEVRNKNFSITDGILRQDGVKVKHVDKKFVLSLLNWIKKDQDKLNTSIKEKTGKNPGLDLYDEKLAQAALPKYNSDILNDNEDLVDKLIDSQKFYDGFVERTKDDKSKLADLARARAKSDIGYYISEALKKGISVEDLQSLGIKLSGDYKKDFSRSKNFATIYENIRKKIHDELGTQAIDILQIDEDIAGLAFSISRTTGLDVDKQGNLLSFEELVPEDKINEVVPTLKNAIIIQEKLNKFIEDRTGTKEFLKETGRVTQLLTQLGESKTQLTEEIQQDTKQQTEQAVKDVENIENAAKEVEKISEETDEVKKKIEIESKAKSNDSKKLTVKEKALQGLKDAFDKRNKAKEIYDNDKTFENLIRLQTAEKEYYEAYNFAKKKKATNKDIQSLLGNNVELLSSSQVTDKIIDLDSKYTVAKSSPIAKSSPNLKVKPVEIVEDVDDQIEEKIDEQIGLFDAVTSAKAKTDKAADKLEKKTAKNKSSNKSTRKKKNKKQVEDQLSFEDMINDSIVKNTSNEEHVTKPVSEPKYTVAKKTPKLKVEPIEVPVNPVINAVKNTTNDIIEDTVDNIADDIKNNPIVTQPTSSTPDSNTNSGSKHKKPASTINDLFEVLTAGNNDGNDNDLTPEPVTPEDIRGAKLLKKNVSYNDNDEANYIVKTFKDDNHNIFTLRQQYVKNKDDEGVVISEGWKNTVTELTNYEDLEKEAIANAREILDYQDRLEKELAKPESKQNKGNIEEYKSALKKKREYQKELGNIAKLYAYEDEDYTIEHFRESLKHGVSDDLVKYRNNRRDRQQKATEEATKLVTQKEEIKLKLDGLIADAEKAGDAGKTAAASFQSLKTEVDGIGDSEGLAELQERISKANIAFQTAKKQAASEEKKQSDAVKPIIDRYDNIIKKSNKVKELYAEELKYMKEQDQYDKDSENYKLAGTKVAAVRKEREDIQEELEELTKDNFIENNKNTLNNNKKDTSEYNKIRRDIEKAQRDIDNYTTQNTEKIDKKAYTDNFAKQTEKVKELQQAYAELSSLQQQAFGKNSTMSTEQYVGELNKVLNKINTLKTDVDKFHNDYGKDKILDTKAFDEYEKEYSKLSNTEKSYKGNIVEAMKMQYKIKRDFENQLLKMAGDVNKDPGAYEALKRKTEASQEGYNLLRDQVVNMYGKKTQEEAISNIKDITGLSRDNIIKNNAENLTSDINKFIASLEKAGPLSSEFKDKFNAIKTDLSEATNIFKNPTNNNAQDILEYTKSLENAYNTFDAYKRFYEETDIGKSEVSYDRILTSLEKAENSTGKINAYFNQIEAFKNAKADAFLRLNSSDDNIKITEEEYANRISYITKAMEEFQKLASKGNYDSRTNKGTLVESSIGRIQDINDAKTELGEYAKNLGLVAIGQEKVNNTTNQVTQKFKTQSGATKTLKGEIVELSDGTKALRIAETSLTNVAKTGNALKSGLSGIFKGVGNDLVSFIANTQILFKVLNQARQGLEVFKQYDTALTKISYTMNVSDKQLSNLGQSAIDMAKDLRMSIQNATDIYQVYANMNTTPEEIASTAKPTAILSNLSGVDTQTASDQVQGILQQFNMLKDGEVDVADASMHVVDVLDMISSNIGVDYSKGIKIITDAVQASGQVAYDAGMSYEQLAAITAKVAERTREDGGSIGNAIKTISTRLSKVNKMPQYASEVSNEEISNAAASLNSIGIDVYNPNGSYRELDVILGELQEKWDGLTDAQKSNISYNIAATRQTSKFKNILEAWTDSMQLAQEAVNADGNALENQEKYKESFEGRVQGIKTQMDEFWVSFYQSEQTSAILEMITNITEVFTGLADTLGPIPALITAVFAAMATKNALQSGLMFLFGNKTTGAVSGLSKVVG